MTENDPQKGKMLMYGRDQTLLEVRCLVLEKSGFRLQTVTKADALHSCLEKSAPSVALIVCHTVPQAERASLHSLAERMQIPFVQMEAFMAPKDLIAATSNLATKQSLLADTLRSRR